MCAVSAVDAGESWLLVYLCSVVKPWGELIGKALQPSQRCEQRLLCLPAHPVGV